MFRVFCDWAELLVSAAKSRSALAAENLFLRKQLCLFQERKVPPHRADDSTRWMMAFLSRLFDLAPGLGDRQARYAIGMASQGVPIILAVEIQARWKAKLAQRAPTVDSKDGC